MQHNQSKSQERVLLVSVSDVETADNGRPYFTAAFKRGLLGKAVSRTFWGKLVGEGIAWERVSPDDLEAARGQDLSAEISIEAVDIEPEEFVIPQTGEVRLVSSRTIIRFADETVEQAVRRCGSALRAAPPQAQAPSPAEYLRLFESLPGAFHVVSRNGNG